MQAELFINKLVSFICGMCYCMPRYAKIYHKDVNFAQGWGSFGKIAYICILKFRV